MAALGLLGVIGFIVLIGVVARGMRQGYEQTLQQLGQPFGWSYERTKGHGLQAAVGVGHLLRGWVDGRAFELVVAPEGRNKYLSERWSIQLAGALPGGFAAGKNGLLRGTSAGMIKLASGDAEFDNVLPGVPGGYVWDDHKFDAADVALCGARIHPDAAAAQLEVTSCWLVWGTYADDYFPMFYGRTRDLAGAKRFHARLSAFMPVDAAPAPPPENLVERGLADAWARTAGPMTPDARRRFRTAIEDMTASWLWELANQIENRIPDPVDYIEMRRKTFGSDLTMSLSRLRLCDAIPPELFQTRALRGIDNSAADYACLTNDVFSYQKEIEFEGELNNGVLVVQRFLDCNPAQAVGVVNDLMTARMHQFEHVVATELPGLVDDRALDRTARDQLQAYIVGLQHWMSGVLEWHRAVARYQEPELRGERRPRIHGRPGGRGTSAMRVAAQLRDKL